MSESEEEEGVRAEPGVSTAGGAAGERAPPPGEPHPETPPRRQRGQSRHTQGSRPYNHLIHTNTPASVY